MKRTLAGLFAVLALPPVAARSAPAPEGLTLSIYCQVDPKGPCTQQAVIRTTDAAVYVQLDWPAPLAAAGSYLVEWIDPQGTVALKQPVQVPAGAKASFAGIHVRGRPASRHHGKWKARVTWQGSPPAEAEFELAPPLVDPLKPKARGGLFQGGDTDRPQGRTDEFTSDNRLVMCRVAFDAAPAADHLLTFKLFTADGSLLGSAGGKTDGKDTAWSWAVGIAGRKWARSGGKFAFRVFWDEDPGPLADLPFEVKPVKRWALLAVVADYPPAGKGGQDLPGNVNNVSNLKRLLIGSYGFREDSIRVLQDLQVTRAAVERELIALADRAGPNDAVLFYYAGHGVQVPDLDGDEDDGWDEAVVPAEPMPPVVTTEEQLSKFLVDDRIAELLERFKTPNLTVIVDTCHSGTAARDVLPPDLPRDMPRTQRYEVEFGEKLLARGVAGEKKSSSTRPYEIDVDQRYVFVSACQPWEVSLSSGLFGGYLTAFLSDGLRDPRARTWEEIMAGVRSGILRANPFQTPTLGGARHRYPFSLKTGESGAPYIRPSMGLVGTVPKNAQPQAGTNPPSFKRVTEGTAGTSYALVSGLPGSEVAFRGVACDVYPAGDPDFKGKPTARIRITGAMTPSHVEANQQGRTVMALPMSLPSAEIEYGTVRTGDRIVPAAMRLPAAKPVVSIRGDFKQYRRPELARLKGLMDRLMRRPEITYSDNAPLNRLDYVLVPSRDTSGNMLLNVILPSTKLIGTFAASPNASLDPVIDLLVRRHGNYTRLIRMSNPSPDFRFEAVEEQGSSFVAAGTTLRFRVRAGRACRVTLLTGTGVTGAWPVENRVNLEVPEKKPVVIEVPLNAKFKGQVAFKLVASTKPLALQGIEKLQGGRIVGTLFDALRKAHGDAGLGGGFVSTNGWADATLWFRVGR